MGLGGRVLCLVADRATFSATALLAALEQVLACVGPRAIVIDRGDAEARVRLASLARLGALCRDTGALLIVSRRVDLALAAGADGVHLPERGLAADTVRAVWPHLVVGRSCHDLPGLQAAVRARADYALLAPVNTPTRKETSSKPLGLNGFSALVQGLDLPVFALGGVTPALAAGLRQAGAAGVATLGDVLGASDPAARALELLRAWDAGGAIDKTRSASDKQPTILRPCEGPEERDDVGVDHP